MALHSNPTINTGELVVGVVIMVGVVGVVIVMGVGMEMWWR